MENAVRPLSEDGPLWLVMRRNSAPRTILYSPPSPVGYCRSEEEANAFVEAVTLQHAEAVKAHPLSAYANPSEMCAAWGLRRAIVTLDQGNLGNDVEWYVKPLTPLAWSALSS